MGIDKHPDCAQPSRWRWKRCKPEGIVVHDIVCPDTWDRNSAAKMIIRGVTQAGSGKFLPGPLYHFIIDHEGNGYRTAENATYTHNAGQVDPVALQLMREDKEPLSMPARRGANGNKNTIGIAMVRSGRKPPTVNMTKTLRKLCKSLCDDHGWSYNRVVGHKEMTSRKIDPSQFNMATLRDDLMNDVDSIPHLTGGNEKRPVLRRGYEGSHIIPAQQRLLECYLLDRVTGVFDEDTEAAVTIYQKCHRLHDDGVIGPKTWLYLLGSEFAQQGVQ